MITTRRETVESDVRNEARSKLGLLERSKPAAFNEVENYTENDAVKTSDSNDERAKNYERLLNYQKYIENKKMQERLASEQQEAIEMHAAVAEEPVAEEATVINASVTTEETKTNKEDITPTSTTMQFGTDDVDKLYADLKQDERKDAKYRLNAHGKIMIAVYAIVVTVIMALIIINTSVLATLRSDNSARIDTLTARTAEYDRLVEEKNRISSDEYVIERATDEYNMVK